MTSEHLGTAVPWTCWRWHRCWLLMGSGGSRTHCDAPWAFPHPFWGCSCGGEGRSQSPSRSHPLILHPWAIPAAHRTGGAAGAPGTCNGILPCARNQFFKHVLLLIRAHYGGYLLLISVNTALTPRPPPAWLPLPAATPAHAARSLRPPPLRFFFIKGRSGNTFRTSLKDPGALTRFVLCQPG